MGLYDSIKGYIPLSVKRYIRYYLRYKVPYFTLIHNLSIRRIRKRNKAKVVFIASDLSMWRYQSVYDAFSKDNRYSLYLLLCPFNSFEPSERAKSVKELRKYFDSKRMEYVDTASGYFSMDEWFDKVDPDILFYPQPFNNLYGNRLDFSNNVNRLICQIPYGINTFAAEWIYNQQFHNIAWKLFYQTQIHLDNARQFADNKGDNVIVVGEPHLDEYRDPYHNNPWKLLVGNYKRVIWAPHFAIGDKKRMLERPGFEYLADDMLKLASMFKDKIQFAFKPHPKLKSELYKNKDWGKEKTDKYYKEWKDGDNTQLADSEFIDLFYHSDGLIHNCGSFTVEYMMTKKPVQFYTEDVNETKKEFNQLGKDCINAHYLAKNISDIANFLDKVILHKEDEKREKRETILNTYFEHNNNIQTVGDRVYKVINSILFQ